MKKISILFIAFTSFFYAQKVEMAGGEYTYSRTITTGMEKNEMYLILKNWIANNSNQYTLTKNDQKSGALSFEQQLPLMHYDDSQSTIPSYTNVIEITNRQIIYRAEKIVFQDFFGGMTNTRNDYGSLLRRIGFSVSTINQLKRLLQKEENFKNKFNIKKEISAENDNLNKLNMINTSLIENFSANAEAIAKQINGTYLQ